MSETPDILIRELVPADAEGLVNCFRRCYGASYPNEAFYDAAELEQRIARRALQSVVAVDQTDRILGHTGLTVRHSQARAIEAGNTVVDPECRGRGLLGQLGKALGRLCKDRGFVGYVHYPTTAHEIMQKTSVTGGGVETGVMLAYIPADTDYKDIDQAAGRLAATVVYQPFTEAPSRDVILPARYATVLAKLYGATGLRRQCETASAPLPTSPTESTPTMQERRGLLHIEIPRCGANLVEVIDEALSVWSPAIAHADLCLDDEAVGAAVEVLSDQGFGFCALLPEFAHTDVLRLQWLAGSPPEVFNPALANPGAKALMEIIRTPA